jgi:hypothetical protein
MANSSSPLENFGYHVGVFYGYHLWWYQSATRSFGSEMLGDFWVDNLSTPLEFVLNFIPGFAQGLEKGKEMV